MDKKIKLGLFAGLGFLCTPLFAIEAWSELRNDQHKVILPPIATLASNTFLFNPNTLTWQAIDKNGRVIRSGKGSGGRYYCRDVRRGCKTPSGVFRIISKGGAGCKSSRYPVGRGGAPMPYCMFFSRYYAIHGSPDVPNYNASHGCIRVKPHDARWLHSNFIRIGTKVVVKPY